MAAEPTINNKPMLERRKTLHPDVIAANEALTLSLIRQQELTERRRKRPERSSRPKLRCVKRRKMP